jgi:hypothetical protein
MTGKDMAIPRELVDTMTRIWQRCSSECYTNYLKHSRGRVFYKNLNQLVAIAVGLSTLALLIAVAAVAWEEIVSLAY